MKKCISIITIIFFMSLGVGLTSCQKQERSTVTKDVVTLNIDGNNAFVELAVTPEEHRKGLMFRDKLEKDHGMLFIFEKENNVSFWMKNTKIPISIAFIKGDGWIAQIEDMTPNSLESHMSEMKVKYALEMDAGWFKNRKIMVGSYVRFPPEITK